MTLSTKSNRKSNQITFSGEAEKILTWKFAWFHYRASEERLQAAKRTLQSELSQWLETHFSEGVKWVLVCGNAADRIMIGRTDLEPSADERRKMGQKYNRPVFIFRPH